MKKITSFLLCILMICCIFSGCANQSNHAKDSSPTREFIDDCGRTVTVPGNISKIAVSGPLTQIYVLPVASDLMVGYAADFSNNAKKYIKPEFLDLPNLGQLYGGKGTMDLEALLSAAPEVVLDVGEAKGNIVEDLDGLTEQTGIPFIHIDATVSTAPAAYIRLGELLGREEQCGAVADYLQGLLDHVNEIMSKVDSDKARKTVLYCLGDKGLNVLASDSFHAETIKYVADNIAVLDDVVSHGDGNEVDMEQLIIWNPEYLIFAPESVYSEIGKDETWLQLDAVKNGNYVETPYGPYSWLQSPPSVQRYLGLIWLVDLLYPEYSDIDLKAEVQEYYKLFYDYELSDADYADLTANAFPVSVDKAA